MTTGEGATEQTTVGEALAAAVNRLREDLGDPTAPLLVLTPSEVNGTFARHELASATPFIRVRFMTPPQLHAQLAAPGLRALGLRPEPPGWLRATIQGLLEELPLGDYGEVMRAPGWLPALVSALNALESGGVDADSLVGLPLEGDLAERARVLGALLEGLDAARAEEGLIGPGREAEAARAAIEEGAAIPANEPTGAILLGDARSSRQVSASLSAWLAKRAVLRVDLPAVAGLEPAWGGLTAAAPEAATLSVQADPPAVRLLRTADQVREHVEIVRRVLRAVRDGVALDRIAVVLPDPSEAVALREALERAAIPATWQTGPPLASTPAALFLLHAIELARGDDSVASWYELLMRPGIRLRQELGQDAVRGRGRWRRLLSRCGAYRRAGVIRAALEASLDELEESEQTEADRAALTSLGKCFDALSAELASWREPRTVGRWARAWLSFLSRFWREGTDKRAVKSLLESWSRADAGPKLSLEDAALTLSDALGSTQVTTGSLRDASIRVLSPMQLLGAELEVVCVASMTQGRFPLNPSEDPILNDPLVEAINEALDAGLFHSSDRVALERRRLAAVRSATRRELWLSCPRVDMMSGRPLLPGTLLLELAEELEGRRVGFEELEASLEKAGGRGRAYAEDPEAALDAAEFLLSRLMEGDAETRKAALRALADHPTGRRLLAAYRAADRIARGARDEALRPWAGFVRPEVMQCLGLDGTTLTTRQLHALLSDPRDFLLRYALGAWRAPRLYEDLNPTRAFFVKDIIREEAQALLTGAGSLEEELDTRFDHTLDARLERAGLTEDGSIGDRVRRIGRRLARLLIRAEPVAGPALALEDAPVRADMAWRIGEPEARRTGAALEWLLGDDITGPAQAKAWGMLAEVAATRATGEAVDDVRWVSVEGHQRTPKDLDALLDGFQERLELVTAMVEAGAYAGEGPRGLHVDTAPPSEVERDWFDEWGAG